MMGVSKRWNPRKFEPVPATIAAETTSYWPQHHQAKKAEQNPRFFDKILTMSSLATAANAAVYHTEDKPNEEVHDDATPNQESLISKTSNQDIKTDGSKELRKHLEKLINEKENKEDPQDEEISFGGGHSFFCPPSFVMAFIANNLCTPDLQHIFWTSIRIPVPPAPSNTTNPMFNALDDFLMKMKETDQ